MVMVASKYFEEGTLELCAGDASQVIPLLQVVQEKAGYVPEDAVAEISEITGAAVERYLQRHHVLQAVPPPAARHLCDQTVRRDGVPRDGLYHAPQRDRG